MYRFTNQFNYTSKTVLIQEGKMSAYYNNINEIKYEGENSTNPMSFNIYDEN